MKQMKMQYRSYTCTTSKMRVYKPLRRIQTLHGKTDLNYPIPTFYVDVMILVEEYIPDLGHTCVLLGINRKDEALTVIVG